MQFWRKKNVYHDTTMLIKDRFAYREAKSRIKKRSGRMLSYAARLQELAAPNTLVISAATLQLLGGFFAYQPVGTPLLKGLTQPLAVYHVLYESMARSRLEAAGSTGKPSAPP